MSSQCFAPARRFAALILVLLSVPALGRAQAPGTGPKSPAKVVVVGFDGADPKLLEKWMDAGYLPNLDRLRREGTYSRLGTTTPPQTPVSWTSFATGRNPGKHGIFDFLSRSTKTYQPDYAMFDVSERPVGLGRSNPLAAGVAAAVLLFALSAALTRRARGRTRRVLPVALAVVGFGGGFLFTHRFIPTRRPTVTRKTAGDTFWERAGKAGRKCRIIRVPAMFPPAPCEHGEVQSGLGVPDLRGTNGTYLFYSTESRSAGSGGNTEKGGVLIPVAFLNGECETHILGPRNKLFDNPPEIQIPLAIRLNRDADPPSVTLTASGHTITLKQGEWSDWFHMVFPFNALITAHGMARFNFVSAEPFGLYMSPINIDPEKPVLPISWPSNFSARLARRFGLFKTLGWENDTFALDEEVIDEKAFMEDVDFTVNAWIPMMDKLLVEDNLDLYVQVWDFTDRVGHMFWRTIDPTHPRADSLADAPYKDVLLKTYQRMDDIVGRVRSRLDPGTLLIVCSDHGFNTWHKSVNYNTWLVRNGFMTLKDTTPSRQLTLEDLFGQGQFWPNVDWSKTRAYALGLGDLYINLKGRESHGMVEPADYEAVKQQLIHGLEAFVDSATGDHPVRHVYRREDVYKGYDPNLIPDLFVSNNAKYRVSWQTSLGGIPPNLFEVNDKKWSGDHCSLDPEITKGIFLCNRRVDTTGIEIIDLYPTILKALGVESPADVDGKALSALP